MKTLSVLITLALFVTANSLAAHLKRANALPSHPATIHSGFQNSQTHHEASQKI
jgi:hypothetical protein